MSVTKINYSAIYVVMATVFVLVVHTVDPTAIVGVILAILIPMLIILGFSMAFSNPFRKMKKDDKPKVSSKDFGQAVLMGLSNPMAIFVMFTLFAFFGLAKDAPHTWSVAPILLSVSLGSVTYWFSVSWLLSHFSRGFKMRTILWISRITGAIIVIIGISLLGQGLFNVVFRGLPIV